MRVFFIGCLA